MKDHKFRFLIVLTLTIWIPVVAAEKYRSGWFYWYDRPNMFALSRFEQTICRQSFSDYHNSQINGSWNGHNQIEQCYLVVDYQSANVILGIMPTILASLGPRIGEVSLLSTTRPVLSFLISIGAPSIWPGRVLDYDDPTSILGSGINKRVLKKQPHGIAIVISALEYLIVCAAIANLFYVAVILGRKTVLTWSCEFDWGPLAWGLIPVFIHVITAISYYLEVRAIEKRVCRSRDRDSEVRATTSSIATTSTGVDHTQSLVRMDAVVEERQKLSWWQRELIICANQPRGLSSLLREQRFSWWTISLNCFAGFLAFFHLIFGTMLFSSLIFIAVYDIWNFVLWRYVLSTVMCRLVLMTELMGMRTEEEPAEVDRGNTDKKKEVEEESIRMAHIKVASTSDDSSSRQSIKSASSTTTSCSLEHIVSANRSTRSVHSLGASTVVPDHS